MIRSGFRAPNHWAIAGFLLPFAAAGIAAALILVFAERVSSPAFVTFYVGGISPVVLAGLVCSIKSLSCITDRGDRDYAYAGLTLNLFFLSIYLLSLTFL